MVPFYYCWLPMKTNKIRVFSVILFHFIHLPPRNQTESIVKNVNCTLYSCTLTWQVNRQQNDQQIKLEFLVSSMTRIGFFHTVFSPLLRTMATSISPLEHNNISSFGFNNWKTFKREKIFWLNLKLFVWYCLRAAQK